MTIAARPSRPQVLDLKQEVPATPIGEGFFQKLSSKINTPLPAANLASRREGGDLAAISQRKDGRGCEQKREP